MSQPLDESAFQTLADSLLAALEEDIGDDAELQAGILTVEGEDGTWIVNKHAPTRQVWLSSPQSGARHFAWDGKAWLDTRGGADLLTVLSGELGTPLSWTP
jgi:frataxin